MFPPAEAASRRIASSLPKRAIHCLPRTSLDLADPTRLRIANMPSPPRVGRLRRPCRAHRKAKAKRSEASRRLALSAGGAQEGEELVLQFIDFKSELQRGKILYQQKYQQILVLTGSFARRRIPPALCEECRSRFMCWLP
jgi:hypothetical protein